MVALANPPIDYITYTAHPKQREFHRAVRQHAYVYFKGGRNSGKTIAGAIQTILEATKYQPGSRGMVVAPTYDMLQDNSMYEFFKFMPRHLIREFNKQRKIVTLVNHTEIAFRSGDKPDSLRGPNRQWAWLDEPRNYDTPEVFNVVSAAIRPTIKMWLTSTPNGLFHWLYKMFTADPLPDSKVIRVRTVENPYRGDGYEARMRSQFSEIDAQQELEADDVSFEGIVYPNWVDDPDTDSSNVTPQCDYDPSRPVIWGVDDGYAYGEGPGSASYHPRVILFAHKTAKGGLDVFDEYYATGELEEASIANALAKPYRKPDIAFVDSSSPALAARIRSSDITAMGATHIVTEGVKNLRRMIGDANGVRLLRCNPRCKNLRREMRVYRNDPHADAKSGEVRPVKIDDHGPDAGRYLSWHLRFGA